MEAEKRKGTEMKKIIIEVADDEQAMQVVEEIETYVFRGYDTPPTMYVESVYVNVYDVEDGKNE